MCYKDHHMCYQTGVETKSGPQNASKNLDNSTNMCDIKLDEGCIVYYYNN
jgi:hypothetical protein